MGSSAVGRARHGPTSDGRHSLGLVDGGFGIHVFRRADVAELSIVGGLRQIVGVGARIVADEVEMLSARGGDAEGLLHEAIRLVAIAIWAFAVRVAGC